MIPTDSQNPREEGTGIPSEVVAKLLDALKEDGGLLLCSDEGCAEYDG